MSTVTLGSCEHSAMARFRRRPGVAWLAGHGRTPPWPGRPRPPGDSGLSEPDYMVLVHLSEAEDRRVRMHDLATRLNWSRSRLSHQLARMQARGLVEREGCATDARGAFAVLSAGGLAEIEQAAPMHVESVRRHLIDVLDREQIDQLAAIAERVVGSPAHPIGLRRCHRRRHRRGHRDPRSGRHPGLTAAEAAPSAGAAPAG